MHPNSRPLSIPFSRLGEFRASLAAPFVSRLSSSGIRRVLHCSLASKPPLQSQQEPSLHRARHEDTPPDPQIAGCWSQPFQTAAVALGLLLLPPDLQALASEPLQLQAQGAVRGLLHSTSSEASDAFLRMHRSLDSWVNSAAGSLSDRFQAGAASAASAPASADQEAAQEGPDLVQEVWELVDEYHVNPHGEAFDHKRWQALREEALRGSLSTSNRVHAAIRTMLARGVADPYTRFVSREQLDDMRKYDITAVGLNLGTAEDLRAKTGLSRTDGEQAPQGGVWVLGVMRGSAATTAGMQQGDELLEIDTSPVQTATPFQASLQIQGGDSLSQPPPPAQIKVRRLDGTLAQLRIPRPPSAPLTSPVSFHLDTQRPRKVGHLRLTSFTGRAQQDLAAAISSLARQGAQEFVLDLRNNGGGIVNGGVEIAQLFLNDGSTVVITQGAQGPPHALTTHGQRLTGAPLALLVNRGSASASEIVAGALADNCRAVLVGPGTHGKASVQSVYELADGSGLVLTVARYLTPSGHNIDREGLQPDFAKMPSAEAAAARLAVCKFPGQTPS